MNDMRALSEWMRPPREERRIAEDLNRSTGVHAPAGIHRGRLERRVAYSVDLDPAGLTPRPG